jgi:DNA-binding transcriptional LysR family regulator
LIRKTFRVRRLPPLNALRTFESAARNGSFLKAATELNVTPGAVSRLVKSLEDALDIQLFSRSRRTVILTEEGRDYAAAIGHGLEIFASATERLVARSRENALYVTCYPTFAAHWLIPRWAAFQAEFPDYQIDLRTSLAPDIADTDTRDFVICIGHGAERSDSEGVISERVLDVETFPVCSPDFLARYGPITTPAQLRGLPLINAALRPNDWDRWLVSAGAAPLGGMQGPCFESIALAYNAAVSGAGIAIGIRTFVAADLEAGRLVRLFTHMRRCQSGFNMFYSAARADKFAKIRDFRDWVIEERRKDRLMPEPPAPRLVSAARARHRR